MSQGFLYCAFGEQFFIDEAAGAIARLLRHNPGAKVCLATTEALKAYCERTYGHLALDRIHCISKPEGADEYFFRTTFYDISPYDRTIALDADTHVAADIQHLFDLLETFDFAAAPDNVPHPTGRGIRGLRGGYAALGMYNTGVLVFRKSPAVRQLFENWRREFSGPENDQKSLLRALVKTELRFISLPWEYNLRLTNQCVSFNGYVRIVHGRVRHPEKFLRMINAGANGFDSASRVWVPTLQRVVSAQAFYPYGRLLKLLNLDKAIWGGRSRIPQTGVVRNLVQAIRSLMRRRIP